MPEGGVAAPIEGGIHDSRLVEILTERPNFHRFLVALQSAVSRGQVVLII